MRGRTPLITAAIYGRLASAKLLVELGAKVNAQDYALGYSALIWALAGRPYPMACMSIEMVRLLIASGADVNTRGSGGWTALMSASVKGQFDVVKELVSAGAEVGAKMDDGRTAESFASREGFEGIAKYLKLAKSLSDAGLLRGQYSKKRMRRTD
ncbi:MAG: ankyrin repeat domain-containing protein [Candidatus Micrarchaeota archaeon]|nr:ankyrin repeat domain-containing protein [Candidatus Micrarchaeota archaeon]